MNIEYDVAIRTVGYGGEKYQALIDSIKNLVPAPRSIYVILPEGKPQPPEKFGNEVFAYAPGGMITQRLAALNYGSAPYILFCDDDIQFAPDFVQKLHRAVTVDGFDIATGEVLAFLPAPSGIKRWLPALYAAAVPVKCRDWFVRILPSSGWTYNRFTPTEGLSLPTQSAAGCMFFASRAVMEKLRFQDELWAQHGVLSPMEDQIMFYKAHTEGIRVCVATDAHYDHLSAKSATASTEAKLAKYRWAAYNRVIFWHRFIYRKCGGFWARFKAIIAFMYFCMAEDTHTLLRNLIKERGIRNFTARLRGRIEALKHIRTL